MWAHHTGLPTTEAWGARRGKVFRVLPALGGQYALCFTNYELGKQSIYSIFEIGQTCSHKHFTGGNFGRKTWWCHRTQFLLAKLESAKRYRSSADKWSMVNVYLHNKPSTGSDGSCFPTPMTYRDIYDTYEQKRDPGAVGLCANGYTPTALSQSCT